MLRKKACLCQETSILKQLLVESTHSENHSRTQYGAQNGTLESN